MQCALGSRPAGPRRAGPAPGAPESGARYCPAQARDPSETAPSPLQPPLPPPLVSSMHKSHTEPPERGPELLRLSAWALGRRSREGSGCISHGGPAQPVCGRAGGVRLPKESRCCSQLPAPADTLQDRRTGGRQPVEWQKGSRRPAWRRELGERPAGEKSWPAPGAWTSLRAAVTPDHSATTMASI